MKALIAVIAVLVIGLLGVGGYFVYQNLQTADEANASQSGSAASDGQGNVQIGSKKLPQNQYDVADMLDAATGRNQDTVAWLAVPNTDISDSVLQGNDNRYYERRDEGGNYNTFGCYYADYECPVGERAVFAANTVIYGHSNITSNDSPDAQRFSQLFRFIDPAFAEKTPYIHLTTTEEELVWQIFAVFYTTTEFDYIRVHLQPADMVQLANDAKALSIYDYGVTVGPEDKLLTLSTCSTKFGTDGKQRFVVMARLLPQEMERPETVAVKKTEKFST